MAAAPPIDPAPRAYPAFVTLMRRAAGGRERAPAACTIADIEAWLLGPALREADMLSLVDRLFWMLRATGLPLDRASLHVGTLHPQLIGFAWNWLLQDGLCDEVKVAAESLRTEAYRRNPLYRVIEFGETVQARPGDAGDAARYPLVAELAKSGFTDYIALPLSGAAYHNAATVATRHDGGFSAEQRAQLDRVLGIFALHVERHIAVLIAQNALGAYLGGLAARRVLSGSIRRGGGEAIRAVIWVSDLRGFTDLSERLAGPDMIALLNAYFEEMAGAVLAQGGEVLKFVGDGALAAARDAIARFERLNADPPPALAAIAGWRPLRSGIALHEGEVFFGNIGAPDRLDFTVIGPTVNQASRVEALQKGLNRPVLVTDQVARLLDEKLESLGEHALRGVARKVTIYGLGGS